MLDPLSRSRRLGTLAVTMAVVLTLYGIVGQVASRGPQHVLESAFDRMVPVTPMWILVYAAIFFQGIAPISTITDRRTFTRTLAGYLLLYALALPFWVFFPVTVPRAPVPIVDVWTYGIGLCRYVDPPANCFPSMHVALALFAALVVRRHDALIGGLLLAFGGLISWSTLAIHQHWLADVALAALLAVGVDHVLFARNPLPPAALQPLPRRWHLTWFGAYIATVILLMSGWWFHLVPVEVLPPNHDPWG